MGYQTGRDQAYLAHLERHRKFVLEAAIKLGVPERGIAHDMSKYNPDEFFPYAEYFYGTWRVQNMPCPPDEQQTFDAAWLLHQKHNDHHRQYWVLHEDDGATKVLPMSDGARREMLADWRGAGMAITGRDNTAEWYLKTKPHRLLHPETLAWVEQELDL